MPAALKRLRRSILLSMLARQTPEKLLRLSQQRLPRALRKAVNHSAAYRQILADAGIDSGANLGVEQVLASVPVLQKSDLFERFPVHELLSHDISPADLAGILTSSGHGGGKFAFGVSTRRQARLTPDDIDLGLEMAFGIDSRTTLLVNCLPMGVVFSSNSVCVANVSVREDMALAILEQAGPLFEQVILCIDPLFGKSLLDHAADRQFDWSSLRTNVILGEEMFSEEYRSYLLDKLQVDAGAEGAPLIGSSMGVGELGLNLFFETADTIALRRSLHRENPDRPLPAFFRFNPLRTFVEVLGPGADGVGDLVISMLEPSAAIPMIRYRTGDRARWLVDEDLAQLDSTARADFERQPFPAIAVLGRDRDRVDQDWHTDHFKALLYQQAQLADHLSGAFVIARDGACLRLDVQLRSQAGIAPEQALIELRALVSASARRRSVPEPDVYCHAYTDFRHGMGLDYERKFRYFQGG